MDDPTVSPLKSPACFMSQAAASLSNAFAISLDRVNQIHRLSIHVRREKHINSVVQNFDRNGICIKLQRLWYKIYVRTCSEKLFKIRKSNRLSADTCLSQTPALCKNRT